MDIVRVHNFLGYVQSFFELKFQPLYGNSIYYTGCFDKNSGLNCQLICCICADIDGEWDEDKDWIIDLNFDDLDNVLRVNTEHPYYDEDMVKYLDDFIKEITQHI